MKKIVASVGLLAIGASGLQAASGLTAEPSKPWSISAALRGFYDDNINSAPKGSGEVKGSFGFEIAPAVQLILPMEHGTLTAGYAYSYKYYDENLLNSNDHDVQTHMFNLGFDHAFSERYQLSIKDAFAIGQEPDILRAGNAMETYQRISGDNIRNFGSINFDGMITRQLGYQIGYANTWMDYDDDNPTIGAFGQVTASTAGLLNRIENIPHLDLHWMLQPQTVGVLGYQFRDVSYNADQVIAGSVLVPSSLIYSDFRNSRSHYGYIGMDHTFRPDLTGSFRIGAQGTEYYNDPTSDNQISPYLLASLNYAYAQESSVEFGLTTDRNATDVVGSYAQGITMDQQTTVIYVAATHRITPKLFGHLNFQYQYSEFNGGAYNDESENYFMVGVNLEYRINQHFGAQIGYNFDDLDSDLAGRDMNRNRVYIGMTARY